VGPLDHTVALRVVSSGGVVVQADDVAEPRPQRRSELGALVKSEVGRHAETSHPLADEGVPAGLRLDDDERYRLQQPAGPVYNCEQVAEPFSGDREQSHDIHVDVGETLPQHRDRLQGSRRLPGHLCSGAGLAVLHTLRHVLIHARPSHSLAHDPIGRPGAWVRYPVEGVDNLASVAQQDHWPQVMALVVTQHSQCAERDELQAETGIPGCLNGGAVTLGLGDGGVLQHLEADRHGINGGSCLQHARQCVGHHVVLPSNVPDVTCELRHVAEVAALAGGPRLHRLREGERERLVVRVQRELPPLQNEAEVPDALYKGQQLPVVDKVADLCCVQLPGE